MTTTIFDYGVLIQALADQKALLYPLLLLILITLFYLLYTIADRHLTWALGHLSKFCRLSPSLAGITFLALGNGAPDFFTNVFGAQEAPEMAIGGSIGSSLFVGVFVLGVALAFYKPSTKEKQPPHLSPTPFLKNAFFYAVALGFLGYFIFKRKIHILPLALMLGAFVIHLGWSIIQHQFHAPKKTSNLKESTSIPIIIRELLLESAYDRLHSLPLYRRIPQAIATVWQHDKKGSNLRAALMIITLPFAIVQNMSILPLEPLEEDYDKPTDVVAAIRCLHRIRVMFNVPFSSLLWKQAVFGGIRRWTTFDIIFYIGNGVFCSVFYMYYTYWRHRPKMYWVHVLNGFAVCMLWIYLISKELVGLLTEVGAFINVDDAVLGSTVLAWGNSFGDLVSIFALSRNGHLETAVTASLCGPVQNVLLTLTIALSISLFKSDQKVVLVDPKLIHSSIFLAWTLCVAMVVGLLVLTPMMFRYRLPRWLGFVLMASYIFTYLPISVYSIIKSAKSVK